MDLWTDRGRTNSLVYNSILLFWHLQGIERHFPGSSEHRRCSTRIWKQMTKKESLNIWNNNSIVLCSVCTGYYFQLHPIAYTWDRIMRKPHCEKSVDLHLLLLFRIGAQFLIPGCIWSECLSLEPRSRSRFLLFAKIYATFQKNGAKIEKKTTAKFIKWFPRNWDSLRKGNFRHSSVISI